MKMSTNFYSEVKSRNKILKSEIRMPIVYSTVLDYIACSLHILITAHFAAYSVATDDDMNVARKVDTI